VQPACSSPPAEHHDHNGAFFQAIVDRYAVMLDWVLARQRLTLLVSIGTLALTALLYVVIPKGFFPVQDTGLIQAISDAPQDTSFNAMASASAPSPTRCWKTPPWKTCPPSSAWTAPTPPSTAGAC
jgi:multidrug efflux pump subunit AcrB